MQTLDGEMSTCGNLAITHPDGGKPDLLSRFEVADRIVNQYTLPGVGITNHFESVLVNPGMWFGNVLH